MPLPTPIRYAATAALPVLLMAALFSESLCASDTDPLSAALERAGDNRQQLQQALDSVPAEQREGLEFLIVNMSDSDLASLSADFLCEHVHYAYLAWPVHLT